MNALLQQYLGFRQKDVQTLLKQHNVTRPQVAPGHPVMHALQEKLQHIENTIAAQHKRKPAQVMLTQAQVSQSSFSGGKSAEEAWHQEVSHNFANNTHKSHLSVYDQLSIMHLAESVLHRLSYQTTNESIATLQQSQKDYLEEKRFPAQYLSKAFPQTFFWQRNFVALSFLENTAPSLYENCYQQLQDVHRQLAQYVAEWQKSIPNAVKRYEHNQENERLQKLAQQYKIPVLTELPEGVHTLPIHGDAHAERYIQDSVKRGYSPALIITHQPAQLVYDTQPAPRPYSTSPALRTQWQSENEAPNDASVGAPEYDSHDEMDDL